MENLDVIVLRHLRDWRLAGHRALLATVVRTWGSSPRPVGSIMALCETGAVVGSVSGGCIEDDLVDRYVHAARTDRNRQGRIPLNDGPPRQERYGVSADEAHRFGLPCGGTLELVLEFNPAAETLVRLVNMLESGLMVERFTDLATGQVRLAEGLQAEGLRVDADTLCNVFGPEYRMLLIGAGQLAEYLATMASFNGFAVTVCDPRSGYSSSWSVPRVALVSEWPDDAVRRFRPDRRSCVLALTHDPKLDDAALLEALQSPAFYVGAIGSRANNEARRVRLITHFDQTEASLARLRGPIGIYIGSKTPAEIAVSVMAEVLAVKNEVPLPRDLDVAYAKHQLISE